MKVVFTGGGTGGHFYPLIAVAEELNKIIDTEAIADSKLYFFAPEPYDPATLAKERIEYKEIQAGKQRVYFSPKNISDWFVTLGGIMRAILALYAIYPDVVFSKGGYGAFPTVIAARFLGIPVIVHESDSAPGRVNLITGKFAQYVALSYPEAAKYFKPEKVAVTGQPVRKSVARKTEYGSHEYLHLDPETPTLLILGGSQGAQLINEVILEALPELVERYQIIHQVGKKNYEEMSIRAETILDANKNRLRYKLFDFLNPLAMSMAAGAATLVVSRAGSTIFEIASWGIPSILVPFDVSNNDHSRKNAYNYARTGAGAVIEEKNLTPHLLVSEINRLIDTKNLYESMSKNALAFFDPHAAERIARVIVNIALEHEKDE